jgi:hypothetical protein
LVEHYTVKRLCFSLKTKSSATACRAAQSISQRLEDYWLGLRLQKMDIPAIEVVKSDIGPDDDSSPLLSEALALYLRLKGGGSIGFYDLAYGWIKIGRLFLKQTYFPIHQNQLSPFSSE